MPIVAPDRSCKLWQWPQRSEEREGQFAAELGIDPLAASVLLRRGIDDLNSAHAFLNPSLDDLHDPRLLPDYQAGADAVIDAIKSGKTIYVHGDYDVDGVTSAALLTRFLTRVGANVVPHVPHRMREGYGIHLDAVKWAKEHGTDLFLTCDCGSSAGEQLAAVYEAGMRAVVTDHHELGDELPRAEAVINPHRADSIYPYPNLSGVGVAFKFCLGLCDELGVSRTGFARAYLDLAVMGTVADVMPLTGENRIITALGLPCLKASKKPGVQALLHVSKLSDRSSLSARDIGFRIGPRINAVGRIDDSAVALDLLLTDDPAEAMRLAEILDRLNTERREQQEVMFDEAMELINTGEAYGQDVLLVARQGWHPGIIGIVAGRLKDRFHRPAFVVAIGNDGIGKGSARSIPGFHLKQAIDRNHMNLLGGGGHELAAGFSLQQGLLADFSALLETMAGEVLTPEMLAPKVPIDVEIRPHQSTVNAARDLARLAPFGTANPEPLLGCRSMEVRAVTPTRNPEHVRVTLGDGEFQTTAMGFYWGDELAEVAIGSRWDVAFTLEHDTYNGRESAKWILGDYCDAQPPAAFLRIEQHVEETTTTLF